MIEYSGLERRTGQTRRRNSLPFLKRLFFHGRRESGRRVDDCMQIVAHDRYSPSLCIGVIMVLCLSLLDATLTLILLSRGVTV